MSDRIPQLSPADRDLVEADVELSEAELDDVIGGIVAPWASIEAE